MVHWYGTTSDLKERKKLLDERNLICACMIILKDIKLLKYSYFIDAKLPNRIP